MDLTKTLNWRYSTKEFDQNKMLTADELKSIKTLLQMSPSSTNIQPWHFLLAQSKEAKERVAKGTNGFYQFNEAKVKNASLTVVFCARTDADEEYMQHIISVEESDGRFPNEEVKSMVYNARNLFANMHRFDNKDLQHWMEKQVYINIGNFLLGVASLGLDALPMEGIDLKVIDEEFGLREKGFTAVAVVAVGHRAKTDFNSTDKTPKSRLPLNEIITELA